MSKPVYAEQIFEIEAAKGDLSALEKLRKEGVPWDSFTYYSAIRNNNLDVVKWLFQNGCPAGILTTLYAKQENKTEIYQWLVENGCKEW